MRLCRGMKVGLGSLGGLLLVSSFVFKERRNEGGCRGRKETEREKRQGGGQTLTTAMRWTDPKIGMWSRAKRVGRAGELSHADNGGGGDLGEGVEGVKGGVRDAGGLKDD